MPIHVVQLRCTSMVRKDLIVHSAKFVSKWAIVLLNTKKLEDPVVKALKIPLFHTQSYCAYARQSVASRCTLRCRVSPKKYAATALPCSAVAAQCSVRGQIPVSSSHTQPKMENSLQPERTTVALVTGANKGIGFEIVRRLCKALPRTSVVYLTARNPELGRKALQKLQAEHAVNVEYVQLDVTNKQTIDAVRDLIKTKHGGLDILINNAGTVGFEGGESLEERVRCISTTDLIQRTVATNFTGLLNVCKALFPLLRSHGRVVHMSSMVGSLALLTNDDLKHRLVGDGLTVDALERIMEDYVRFVPKESDYGGYPETGLGPFAMSKLAVNALTRVQQRDFDLDKSREDIVVNSCYPGYTATDLTNHRGTRTAEEAARTPVYLALLGSCLQDENGKTKDIPRGQFVRDREVFDWTNGEGCMKMSDVPRFDAKT